MQLRQSSLFLLYVIWMQVQHRSQICHSGITLAGRVEWLTVNRSRTHAGSSGAAFHSLLGLVHQARVSHKMPALTAKCKLRLVNNN